jgi:Spy/CpxP family protein refolding chaperone
MKKSFLSIALVAVALLIGMSSCDKGDDPWGPGDGHRDFVSGDVLTDMDMPYLDAAEITVEGDIDAQDLEVYPEFNGRDDHDKGRDRDHDGDRGRGHHGRKKFKRHHGPGYELMILLRKLQLTPDQRKEFYDIMKEYRDCVHDVMTQNREQRKEIIQKAREARLDIIKAYKAGDIDRKEAIAKLRQLYTRVKEALNDLVDKDALCNCYIKMLRNLYNILTDEQKVAFKRWLEWSKNPCLENFKNDRP